MRPYKILIGYCRVDATAWVAASQLPLDNYKMMDFGRIRTLLDTRRDGHCLPQALYNAPEAFEFDMHACFGTGWLAVGFECEVSKPGSYVSQLVGNWPVLITRDRDGVLRAFHNSCRHRGSVLCPRGAGAAPRIVCPYHNWTYNLDGSLLAAPRMPDGFDKSAHGLKPIRVEAVAGVLFISFSENPPPFAEFAARFADYMAGHDMANAKLAAEDDLMEYANWKLVMENGRECYHCATGHPELARTFPVGMSKHFDVSEDKRAADFLSEMKASGLECDAIEGSWWQLARFALNPGVQTLSMSGDFSVKKLLCSANGGDVGSMRLAVDPHAFLHATGDQVFLWSAVPVGPNETRVTAKWVVHKDAVEGVDYDLPSLMDLWTRTNFQDKRLAENNQAGVNSPGYTPGPYSPEAEMLAMRFTDWYCDTANRYLSAHGS